MTRESVVDFHVINENKDIETLGEYTRDTMMELLDDGEIGFTSGLNEKDFPKQISVDDIDCFAKMKYIPHEDGGPITMYFAKIGISGFLFDPWGLFSEGTQAKDAKHLGKNAWNFRKITQECFKNYLTFLGNRNKAYFNLAEREIRSNAS